MALSQNLVQKQTQKLVITQDLRQSIELLPLSNLELSDRIQKELIENPLLEEVAGEEEPYRSGGNEPAEQKNNTEENRSVSEWKESYDSYTDSRDYSSAVDKTESRHQFLQNGVSSRESLWDHLLWQLNLAPLSSREIDLGRFLISSIDDRGFLIEPLEDLIRGTRISPDLARKVLSHIQEFDPVGCGATGIQETLMIQCRVMRPDDRITMKLLEHHLADLEKLDYRKITKEAGITEEELERSLQFIRTMEPYPGTLHSGNRPDYIIPDLMVIEEEGSLEVLVNDSWIPGLTVNPAYGDLAKGKGTGKEADREYLQQKLSSAQWLIKSIEQRRNTMYRVMKAIVEFQAEFFRTGHANLVPLTLKEVAEKVELHESTVSRITTNKFVETRWGIFELKYFFSSSLRGNTGGETHSSRSVQDRIRQFIESEDENHPLSDQEIVELMKGEDVQIARRTVAKYRKVMKIPPADRRKKLKKLHHSP